MKKIAYFASLVILAGLVVVACKKDDDSTPPTEENKHTITGLDPEEGPVGQEVVIIGTNFTDQNATAAIGGTAATITGVNTDKTELYIEVPNGATDGKISVTIDGLRVESTQIFDVTETIAGPESIELADTTLEMRTLDTAEYPQITNLDEFENPTVSYESDNTEIIYVDADGKIIALQAGSANVTISIGNLNANVEVNVENSIFVGGYTEKNDGEYGVATVWKNSVAHELSATGGSYDTYIALEGPNLYATNVEYGLDDISAIKVYKNNTLYGTVGNVDQKNRTPKAIQVEGGDIYICGFEVTDGTQYAKYWKNGTENVLSNINKNASAEGMVILDGVVYVAGDEQNEQNTFVAKYWKNGVATDVTSGTNRARAHSIYVDGNTVYTAGYEDNQAFKDVAKSWISETLLYEVGDGINNSVVESIVVDDTNVYMAGIDWGNNMAKLWINGEHEINLTSESKESYAYEVVVFNGAAYVVGSRQSEEDNEVWVPVVWVVNSLGEIIDEMILPSDTNAYANSIIVK